MESSIKLRFKKKIIATNAALVKAKAAHLDGSKILSFILCFCNNNIYN